MAKSWPDYMGTYKGIVLEWGIGKSSKKGLPQFNVRVFLTDYYDQKEGEWMDVSDNNWTINAYLVLYGREGGAENGEIAPTLNHQQVCSVFGWDGCGFEYLTTPGRFADKVIQVRIEENTVENAKTPCQISWIDTEDSDPNAGLRCLDSGQVKALETEFSHLWKGKKAPPAVSAKKPPATVPATKKAPPQTAAVKNKSVEPVTDDTPADDENDPTQSDAARKKAILEKGKRLRAKANEKSPEPPAKAKKNEPAKKADVVPDQAEEVTVPDDYGKKAAWNDIIDLRDQNCTDQQQKDAWDAAIAEVAPDGDEDKLDAAGWWKVKDQVVAEIGQFE